MYENKEEELKSLPRNKKKKNSSIYKGELSFGCSPFMVPRPKSQVMDINEDSCVSP